MGQDMINDNVTLSVHITKRNLTRTLNTIYEAQSQKLD